MTRDASSEIGWANPAKTCDPVFKNIMVSYDGSLHYRIFAPEGKPLSLAFGVCEGYYKSAGQRILEIQVNGKIQKTLDPVTEFGPNVPGVVCLDAKDDNDKGMIDVTIQAAPNSPDRSPILNALWVFDGPPPSPEKVLQGSYDQSAAAFYHAETQDAPLAVLDLGNAIAETREFWAATSKITTNDALVIDTYSSASNTLP